VSGVIYGGECNTSLTPTSWYLVTNTGSGGVHTFTVTINGATQLFLRLPVTEQGFSGCVESARFIATLSKKSQSGENDVNLL
jgi:hypothetical protein